MDENLQARYTMQELVSAKTKTSAVTSYNLID